VFLTKKFNFINYGNITLLDVLRVSVAELGEDARGIHTIIFFEETTLFSSPKCAKTHLRQSRILKFTGGPPDPEPRLRKFHYVTGGESWRAQGK